MTSDQSEHVVLTPAALHILLALSDGDKHGYGIMQEVTRFTEGALRLGPGTLYRSIRQLIEGGLIAEAEERPDPELDDERRRYYRLTAAGISAAQAELARLERLVALGKSRGLLAVTESA